MKEHWKRRHQRNHEAKAHDRKRSSRILLPRPKSGLGEGVFSAAYPNSSSESELQREENIDENHQKQPSVPAQLLNGMSFALSTSKPDPFQTCPIHLTSQHQKLLYHWIGTHAAMMFEDLDVTEFNPMKDVWFPLDLSNASSFNCIMAHSAAHLSHLYAGTPPARGTTSSEALKYKLEALRILRLWLGDPEKELSEDAFSAVVRLLTFERYWGTVEDWNVHRDGLQRMIDAKGGIDALHENWRLELVVYLVSLMSRPSWLEPTNDLEKITHSRFSHIFQQQTPPFDMHMVRCLWLLSFVQDMRTFMGSFCTKEFSSFPFFHDAIDLLRQDFQLSLETCSNKSHVTQHETELLVCVFSISVLVQESLSPLADVVNVFQSRHNALAEFEEILRDSHQIWRHSAQQLRYLLYNNFMQIHEDGQRNMNYTMNLVQVLSTLSLEARQGVEKCLLNLLYQLGNKDSSASLKDDSWSPDSLLSSIHGH